MSNYREQAAWAWAFHRFGDDVRLLKWLRKGEQFRFAGSDGPVCDYRGRGWYQANGRVFRSSTLSAVFKVQGGQDA